MTDLLLAPEASSVETPTDPPRRGLVGWMDRALYPGQGRRWDDALFRARILRELAPDARLLDLGAGAGIVPEMRFRGLVAHAAGVDVDERVLANPHLDEARVARGEALPFPDASFDVVVSDNVLEHLDDPAAVLAEIARVLRPGGRLLFKTPNRRHYMPFLARLTPTGFHRWVNRRRGRAEADTFPTRYRANTPGDVRRLAREAGLAVRELALVEGRPEYLRFHPVPYAFGFAWERLVNATPALAPLRVVLTGVLEKPA